MEYEKEIDVKCPHCGHEFIELAIVDIEPRSRYED